MSKRAAHTGLVLVLASVLPACSSDPPAADPGASGAGDAAGSGTTSATLVEREGFLEGAGGVRLHYEVLGSGPDTVVVVHGGPGAGINSVRPAFEPLARELTTIFYDQRGGGRSELPADTTRLRAEAFVEDLEAVRQHFGLERMAVLAHSFGAVLAAAWAGRHPDRVERLVFHGATGPTRDAAARAATTPAPDPDPELTRRATGLLRSLLRGEAPDPLAACREYESLQHRLAEARGERVTWPGTTCGAPPEAVRYYYRHTAQAVPRSFGAWDFTHGELDALEAPLLVIWGRDGESALPGQREWASAVSDGRLLLVPGAGKAAASDRPDVVLPAIATFLRGSWPDGARRPSG